jgi:riboflavin transporter FmnP
MVHRGIATLAGALMVSFLWLSNLEPQFFLLHFYQSLVYLAIILMLFYFEDRYAYMLGIMAPAVWLLLNYATGLLGGALRQVGRLMHAQMPNNQVSLMAAVTAVLSLLMIVFCAYRWKREFAGTGKTGITIGVSFVVVAAYYGVLIAWFWNLVPKS